MRQRNRVAGIPDAGMMLVSIAERTVKDDWPRPDLDRGALEPVPEPWWTSFSGPCLYYPGRRLLPAPLRAFVDFVKARADTG